MFRLRPVFITTAAVVSFLAAGVNLANAVPAAPSTPTEGRTRAAGRAWIGITMEPKASGPGVLVLRVSRGGPAQKHGLATGDRVLRVAGVIVQTPEQLAGEVSSHRGGDTLLLNIQRGDKEIAVSVVTEPRPTADELLRREYMGTFAPEWTDTTPLAAAPKTLAQLRGRVVVLDFWASFCGPCRMSIPSLSRLSARYSAQGLTVVGMTSDDAETASLAGARLGVRYPIVVDAHGKTQISYSVNMLPTLFVIDKRGVVRHIQVGFDSESEAGTDAVVAKLLAEPGEQPPERTEPLK